MVTVSVDNTPVSETTSGGSITVPAGEVWKVTVTAGTPRNGNSSAIVTINGEQVGTATLDFGATDEGGTAQVQFRTVLVDGDTIAVSNGGGSGTPNLHVGGFVVN